MGLLCSSCAALCGSTVNPSLHSETYLIATTAGYCVLGSPVANFKPSDLVAVVNSRTSTYYARTAREHFGQCLDSLAVDDLLGDLLALHKATASAANACH